MHNARELKTKEENKFETPEICVFFKIWQLLKIAKFGLTFLS